jgi:putative ABC transport system permease protein
MKPQPPNRPLHFLRWFCREDYLEEIEGDLTEVFEKQFENHPRQAKWEFAWSVVRYFRPAFIKSFRNYYQPNSYSMYKSYFKIGWRNLAKNKGYSFINIGGLAMGMAVAMIIGLWVYDELSFNRYHQNYPHIARIMKGSRYEGKSYKGQMWLQYPLVNELKTSYQDNFKYLVTACPRQNYILSTGEKKVSRLGQYIEHGAPEMFTWKMIYGTWSGLKAPQSIMLSASTAKALFGDTDPMDKSVQISNELDVKVTGVYEDFPLNTEFHGVQFFAPWDLYVSINPWVKDQGWDNHFLFAYVEINPNTNFEKVSANIREAELTVIKDMDNLKEQAKSNPQILLHPMSNWHLYSNFKDGAADNGPVQLVWLVGSIGGFV